MVVEPSLDPDFSNQALGWRFIANFIFSNPINCSWSRKYWDLKLQGIQNWWNQEVLRDNLGFFKPCLFHLISVWDILYPHQWLRQAPLFQLVNKNHLRPESNPNLPNLPYHNKQTNKHNNRPKSLLGFYRCWRGLIRQEWRPHLPQLIVVIAHPRYLDVRMGSVLAGSGLAEYGLADSGLLTYQIPV